MVVLCPTGYLFNSSHKSWESAADKVEVLMKKGLNAQVKPRPAGGSVDYLVFQSKNKRRTKELVYTTEQIKFRGGWETRIRANGTSYFSWRGDFFAKKESAEKDLKRILARNPGDAMLNTWGFKVFRTEKGYGVFAEV